MISIVRIFWFSASHTLPFHEGACKNQHGHNFRLEVKISGKTVTEQGAKDKDMLMDFSDLGAIVNSSILSKLDHTHLNDTFNNPTAEYMVEWIAAQIQIKLPLDWQRLQVTRIRLWETEKCYAEWTPSK